MLRESELCIPPSGSFHGYPPPREATCHVTAHACPISSREGSSETELTDRRIGLNINYSIIFTEISFFSETSILLQIIRIIHMTIWIIPESDREGGQSFRSGSKVVYTMRLPQTKTRPDKRASWRTPIKCF